MRNSLAGSIILLAATLAFCSAAGAQTGQEQGSQPAGAAQGRGQDGRRVQGPSPTANLPFDPHDLSGVWMGRSEAPIGSLGSKPPAMTPWAQAKFDAAKPGIGPRAQPLGNDQIMICDPIGYPRIAHGGDYPMEFVQTKDRLIEFFDFFYTYRTIYLDGRPLPTDPEPTWYGYSVGHWEGNILVVETTGFNDRSWLDTNGHPHSDQMRIEEHFQRVDRDTINAKMTVTDPIAYTAPWVTEVTWKLNPKQRMREDVCAPSDESQYKEEMREPAARKN
jgi:hypothetical protein